MDDDRQNSLLTTAMRKWVAGEKEIEDDDYRRKFERRLYERVTHGLKDLSLLSKHRDRIDPLWLLMERGIESNSGKFESVREGWREIDAYQLIPDLLTFLMSLSLAFNYGNAEWQRWVKQAYETVNPHGYASVSIETIPELDLDELDAIFHGDHDERDRDDLRQIELHALLHNGCIDIQEYVDAGGEIETFGEP